MVLIRGLEGWVLESGLGASRGGGEGFGEWIDQEVGAGAWS